MHVDIQIIFIFKKYCVSDKRKNICKVYERYKIILKLQNAIVNLQKPSNTETGKN